MFEFDGCIDVMFERLVRFVDSVDVKYSENSLSTHTHTYINAYDHIYFRIKNQKEGLYFILNKDVLLNISFIIVLLNLTFVC